MQSCGASGSSSEDYARDTSCYWYVFVLQRLAAAEVSPQHYDHRHIYGTTAKRNKVYVPPELSRSSPSEGAAVAAATTTDRRSTIISSTDCIAAQYVVFDF